jgi:aminocarboxymuconate-semialdehyde decarboxylase
MPVVDAHTHLIPLEFVELLRSGDGPPGLSLTDRDDADPLIVHDNGLAYPVLPVFHDVTAKLTQMDRDGIDVSLMSLVPSLFLYWTEAAETARVHRIINDAAAAMVRAGGGRLAALATVPLNDPAAAERELRRACGELGLLGAEIGTSVGPTTLEHPQLEPFFSAAQELGVPLMLHPYLSMVSEPDPTLRGFHLSNVIGNPLETFAAAARLIVGGVLDRHPRLRFLLVHGGGALPYQLGRLDHAYSARADTSERAARSPSRYLENFLYDTIVFDPRALDFLIDFAGVDRVLFGTDLPFDMADTSALGLSARRPAQADRVLGENALRAFSIPSVPAG